VRLDAAGQVYVLEANPNPQIAHDEDFAESAAKARYSYAALLQALLHLGLRWRPAKAA
jgi:D-alanine-D-alanine ligase